MNYIDHIFRNNKYKENIRKYVYKEIDDIDFNINEVKNDISNEHSLYTELLKSFYDGYDDEYKENEENLLRLFKVVSMHETENLYIFEMLAINILSGMSLKEAMLKLVSYSKILKWNEANKENPISSEIVNIKMHIIIYFYYAKKFFPKETDEYVESVYNSEVSEIIEEYREDAIIPLIGLSIKVYYGDDKYSDRILEYLDKINYLDAIISVLMIMDKNDEIRRKLLYLLENDFINGDKNLIVYLAYSVRIFFFKRKQLSIELLKDKSFNEFLEYLHRCGISAYFLFLINYLDEDFLFNSHRIYDNIKIFYEEYKGDFYKLYEILKTVFLPRIMELKILLTAFLFRMEDDKADVTFIEDGIDYLKDNLKTELESLFGKKSDDLFKLLKSVDKNDLSLNLNENINYIAKFIALIYDYNEEAKKIMGALLESLPYNLAIPAMIKERRYFYNIKLNDCLEHLKGCGLDLKDLIITYLNSYPLYIFKPKYMVRIIKNNSDYIANLFKDEEFIKIISDKSYALIDFLYLLYDKASLKDYSVIFNILNFASEETIEYALKLVEKDSFDLKGYVENNLQNYKIEAQNELKGLLKKWNSEDKNFLFNSLEEIIEYVNYYYETTFDDLTAFIEDSEISEVSLKNGDKIPVKVLRYIFGEYMSLKSPYRIRDVDKMTVLFDMDSFRNTLENIYLNHSENIADKNVILPYCIYADERQISELRLKISYWEDNLMESLAEYVIPAVAMNGEKYALTAVNDVYKVSKNKGMRKAVRDSFVKAAECLNVSVDTLFDKITPNLGFNAEGSKTLDYGKRSFTIRLLGDSYLEIIDNDAYGIIKELPEASEGDDIEKVREAKKEFEETKRTLETVVSNQKIKLRRALMNGRKWDYKTFLDLFVNNPIMRYFTLSIVWGVYDENDDFISSFRYIEDGSFFSIDEDLYEFPEGENNHIGLYNITDNLGDEKYYFAWKKQFELYEIYQPINQFQTDKIFVIKEEDVEDDSLTIFKGRKIDSSYIYNLCEELGMESRYLNENVSYLLFDDSLKIACKINCHANDEEIIMEDVKFYELEKNKMFNKTINPIKINFRFVNSILNYISIGLY